MVTTEQAADREKALADQKAKKEEAAKLQTEAAKLRADAAEARAKADASKQSPEEQAAVEAERKATEAQAKADEAERHAEVAVAPMTAGDAKVLAPVDPAMPAGHHLAQKFGNDPANPKGSKPEHDDPELKTVRLVRQSPDPRALIRTSCHPEMEGDYLRAGWSLDPVQLGAYPLTAEEQKAADAKEKEAVAESQAAAAATPERRAEPARVPRPPA
jgi:hypothetical protein